QVGRVRGGPEMLRLEELAGRHLAGGVDHVLQVLDAALGEVVADGRPLAAERDRHRQPDVAQPDDGYGCEPGPGLRACGNPVLFENFRHWPPSSAARS